LSKAIREAEKRARERVLQRERKPFEELRIGIKESLEIKIGKLTFSHVEKYFRTRQQYLLSSHERACLHRLEMEAKRRGIYGFWLSYTVFDFPEVMLEDVEKCLGAKAEVIR